MISSSNIPAQYFTDWLGELSSLLKSRLSLHEALRITRDGQDQPALTALIEKLLEDIGHGKSFADALSAHWQYFPAYITDVLREGEKKQCLAETLGEVFHYAQANELMELNLGARIKSALAYPLALLAILMLLLGFMSAFVIPNLSSMFSNFGAQLPNLTQSVLMLSDFIVTYWYFMVAVIVGALLYLIYGGKGGTYLRNAIVLWMPGFGGVFRHIEWIRALRAWHFTLAHGGEPMQALAFSAQMAGNLWYADIWQRAHDKVAAGMPLAEALQSESSIPKKLVQTLLVVSHGNDAHGLLERLADRYIQRARIYFELGSRFFTLFLILAVWVIIAIAVIAMYLPIFQMGQFI